MRTFIDTLPPVWEWLVQSTLEACLLICAIRVVQLVLRGGLAPKWYYALWLLVVARMLMPWAPESAISAFNLFVSPTPPVVEPLPIATGAGDYYSISSDYAAVPLDYSLSFTPVEELSAWELLLGVDRLALTWLYGVGVLLAFVLKSVVTAGTRFRRAPALDDPRALSILDECREAMGIKGRLATRVTSEIRSPALFGLLRPRLLLPEGLAETLTDEQLRNVFFHELAHYKRRDIAVNWVVTVLQILHWFNPLVWYAFYRMRADREVACDALALSYIEPENSQAYGHTILELMERNSQLRRLPNMVGVAEGHSQLKRRLAAIAQFEKRSFSRSFLGVLSFLVLASILLTDARAYQEAGDAKKSEEGAAKILESVPDDATVPKEVKVETSEAANSDDLPTGPVVRVVSSAPYYIALVSGESEQSADPIVNIEFQNVDLGEAVRRLAALGKLNIVRGAEIRGSVSANLQGVPLSRALQVVLQTNGYGLVEDARSRRNIVFEGESGAQSAPAEVSSEAPSPRAAPTVSPSVNERPAPRPNPKAAPESRVEESTAEILGEARRLIARELFIEAIDRYERVLFAEPGNEEAKRGLHESTIGLYRSRMERREGTFLSFPSPPVFSLVTGGSDQAEHIRNVLEERVTVVFEDIHIQNVLDFIIETYDVNIMIDNRVVRMPKGAKGRDADGAAYVTDGMVPYINLKEISLGEALRALTHLLNLDYSVQPGFIWISSPEIIRTETFEDLETRFYKISDPALQSVFKKLIRRAEKGEQGLEEKGPLPVEEAFSEVEEFREFAFDIVDPKSGERRTLAVYSPDTNSVIIHHTPSFFEKFEAALKKMPGYGDGESEKSSADTPASQETVEESQTRPISSRARADRLEARFYYLSDSDSHSVFKNMQAVFKKLIQRAENWDGPVEGLQLSVAEAFSEVEAFREIATDVVSPVSGKNLSFAVYDLDANIGTIYHTRSFFEKFDAALEALPQSRGNGPEGSNTTDNDLGAAEILVEMLLFKPRLERKEVDATGWAAELVSRHFGVAINTGIWFRGPSEGPRLTGIIVQRNDINVRAVVLREAERNGATLLAAPRITVLDGSSKRISNVEPLDSGLGFASRSGAGRSTVSVGTTLTAAARLLPDGRIRLELELEHSYVVGQSAAGRPVVDRRESKIVVLFKPGLYLLHTGFPPLGDWVEGDWVLLLTADLVDGEGRA